MKKSRYLAKLEVEMEAVIIQMVSGEAKPDQVSHGSRNTRELFARSV
jgi:hypothetical protein